jgi:hypothetical protein
MRKPTASAWKTVQKKLDRVVAFKEAVRIGGLVRRSPNLNDGTIELSITGPVYFLSVEQIDRLRERFPFECDGHETELPVTPGRTAMSEADLVEYMEFIERRNHAHRSANYPKSEG